MKQVLVVAALVLGSGVAAQAQIVGHAEVDEVAGFPQSTMDAIGEQRWLFTHASVGANMVSGLADLHAANPTRYQLVTSWVGFDEGQGRAEDPPASTVPGTVYECDRGNPGWAAKLEIFDDSVQVSGWSQPAVDVAMDKLCYVDPAADLSAYIASMTALAAAYPEMVFVYATMPLTTDEDQENVQRNQYNQAVRDYCEATGCLLFDVADMEAHSPAGAEQTFSAGGETYQKLYSGYTNDGGHLDATGRQRIALGWYAVAKEVAQILGGGGSGPCVADADTLCLLSNRFQVEVTWEDYSSNSGNAQVASGVGTSNSGLFYWVNPNNWELLIKVLNGCSLNNRYWVYFAATTDIEFVVTVTDTDSGAYSTYTNTLGHPANAVTDANAFDTCP